MRKGLLLAAAPAVLAAALVFAGDAPAPVAESGYDVAVHLEAQGDDVVVGKATVKSGAGKVLAAPSLKTKRGQPAEAESEEPVTHRLVRFRLAIGEGASASYSLEILEHGVVVSRHQADVQLGS